MMVKMTRTFLPCLFAFLFMLEGHACTMVLVSGNATADGRPLMFKNRDSDDSLGVEMRIVEPRGFTYLGQFTKSTGPWGGYNEKGFVIANTLAYNVPAQSATQNSWVTMKGLASCESVGDFEMMLDSMMETGMLMVKANYAVMDAQGNAAFYEVWESGYVKYDVNDRDVAPDGVLVRTNYCFSGTSKNRKGVDRHRIASIYMKGFQGVKVGWQDLLPLSRLLVNQNGVDLRDSAPKDYYDETPVVLDGFIPRNISTNAMVIQGVREGESPLLTTCWVTVGVPMTTVVVPFCLTLDKELPAKAVSKDGNMAWLCEKGWTMRNKVFAYKGVKTKIDLSKLYNQEETGVLQTVLRLEDEIIQKGEALFGEAREAGEMSSSALHAYYEWLDSYLEDEYVDAFGRELLRERPLVLPETLITFYLAELMSHGNLHFLLQLLLLQSAK